MSKDVKERRTQIERILTRLETGQLKAVDAILSSRHPSSDSDRFEWNKAVRNMIAREITARLWEIG